MHQELILCFSTIGWDFLWQRHQELMCRFARDGNRVIYVEPLGIRVPKWEDRSRVIARLANRLRAGPLGLRAVQPNLWIHDPLVLPFQSVGWMHVLNRVALQGTLRTLLRRHRGLPLIWTYVPTRLVLDLIKRLDFKLLIYDCVDALALNPKGVFSNYRETEIELSRMADLVFVSSTRLFERQRPLNPHTYLVPNGVDLDCFDPRPRSVPTDLAAIPRPRLGFFGGLDERVDLELVDFAATKHPEWSLVFLGVVRTDVSRLQERSNVFFLGVKAHPELPAYLAGLDVLLVPYAINDYTVHMYPAKIHECLAVGKPTVVTALPELEAFRDVLYLTHSPQQFENAILEALSEGLDSARVRQRRAVAEANMWSVRYEQINRLVDERCQARNSLSA
jgi:glycosyltransferase involved in cell wall biosynthesis